MQPFLHRFIDGWRSLEHADNLLE